MPSPSPPVAREPVAATIDLSADQVVLATADPVRDAAAQALAEGATHYTDRPGLAPLRRLISERVASERGIFVDPATEVLVTCGDQEALFVALQSHAGQGDEVLIAGPAPAADLALVRMVGAAARVAEPAEDLTLDPEAVSALIGPRTRLLLVRTPSAVGQIVSEADLARLAELAVAHELIVIVVESDAALLAPDETQTSLGALPGAATRTITIADFSGCGLGPWRVGWTAAQSELMAPMRRLKQELSICSPAVSQHAALAAAQADGPLGAAARRELDERRTAVVGGLRAAGVATLAASSSFVLVDPGPLATEAALGAAGDVGVVLADAAILGAPGWLRLTLDAPSEQLAGAAASLGAALGAAAGAHV